MRRLTVAIVAAMMAAGAMAVGAASQERAEKVNEDLRKNLAWFFVNPNSNPGHAKTWTLKALTGKDSELANSRSPLQCEDEL